ncbi:hypothetical protein [Pelosinus baikalensis]|uniref:Uncharacterized protein n=1 Tax=Pelosinus baikalensis TaxID=2892015 RepID=A0ABS8HLS5_9FIRM|nr:hypothetical protein [Pelosinus baikalensis]MCC5464130.1 hypothetical protein [Pelosinus baikalensis]
MKEIKLLCVFLFILLVPFQDTSLQQYFGFLGASPSFFPISVLIFLSIIEGLINYRNIKIKKVNLVIFLYVVLISSFYLIIFGTESHGENLIIKAFKIAILTVLFLYPIFYINYDHKWVRISIKIAFLISVIGVILNDYIDTSLMFHYHENLNMRPRGFSLESSWLSSVIVTLGLLVSSYSKSKIRKIIYIFIMLSGLAYSASKGGIIAMLLAGFCISFFYLRGFWLKVTFTLMMIIASVYLYGFLDIIFLVDINEYTSTATRSGLAITSLFMILSNPFGVGFTGFLPAINVYIPQAIEFIQYNLNISLNFSELSSYVAVDSAQNISAKSFLLEYSCYFGLPFLIIFLRFHNLLIEKMKGSNNMYILMALIYTLIGLSTYLGGVGLYNVSLLYGVIYSEIMQKKNIHSI